LQGRTVRHGRDDEHIGIFESDTGVGALDLHSR
jgi:hypothetical protein